MDIIQRLDGDLHKLATRFHYLINFPFGLINNGAPLSWNPKAFYALNFILALEPTLSDLHSLPNICTYRMFGVNNSPRVMLKDEHRSGTVQKAIKELLEWNIVYYLWELVDLLKSMIDLRLVLLHLNFLRFCKGIEVMRELQPAQSRFEALPQLLIEFARTIQQTFQVHADLLFALFRLQEVKKFIINFEPSRL